MVLPSHRLHRSRLCGAQLPTPDQSTANVPRYYFVSFSVPVFCLYLHLMHTRCPYITRARCATQHHIDGQFTAALDVNLFRTLGPAQDKLKFSVLVECTVV
jgi:hypothetical protein